MSGRTNCFKSLFFHVYGKLEGGKKKKRNKKETEKNWRCQLVAFIINVSVYVEY